MMANRIIVLLLLVASAVSNLSFTAVSVSNEDVTLKMLNCKTGVYRTYGDFLKGNAEPLTFVRYKYSWVGGSMRNFDILFKDADGKKVHLHCDEFWGWKCDAGLFRNVPYQTGKVNAISTRVTCVGDFVYYETFGNGFIKFSPEEWVSKNLKSEMMPGDIYVKKYPDSKYAEVHDYLYKKCTTISVTNSLELRSYNRPDRQCLLKCPDLLYTIDDYNEKGAAKYIEL